MSVPKNVVSAKAIMVNKIESTVVIPNVMMTKSTIIKIAATSNENENLSSFGICIESTFRNMGALSVYSKNSEQK